MKSADGFVMCMVSVTGDFTGD